MEEIIRLKPGALAFLAVFSIALLFYLYYFTSKQKVILNRIMRPAFPSLSDGVLEFLSEKLGGIIFTGIIPAILFLGVLRIPASRAGLQMGLTFEFRYLIIILVLVTCLLSYVFSRKSGIQAMSADLKIKNWYPRHLFLYSAVWIIYIFGYELLFRGILWSLFFEAFGFWPALLINLLLYSAVHISKGKFMALGALPTGIILCLLSYLTGSFLPAFFIHSTIAVMTGLFSVYHNPEIRVHLKTQHV